MCSVCSHSAGQLSAREPIRAQHFLHPALLGGGSSASRSRSSPPEQRRRFHNPIRCQLKNQFRARSPFAPRQSRALRDGRNTEGAPQLLPFRCASSRKTLNDAKPLSVSRASLSVSGENPEHVRAMRCFRNSPKKLPSRTAAPNLCRLAQMRPNASLPSLRETSMRLN